MAHKDMYKDKGNKKPGYGGSKDSEKKPKTDKGYYRPMDDYGKNKDGY